MQRPLAGERLELIPATTHDLDALWALWTHPDVRRFLWDDRVITRDEAAATLADCAGLGPQGLGLWLLRSRGARAGPALGCAGLLPVTAVVACEPRLAGLVEPLVALEPAVWGRGYATESLRALIAYAVGELRLPRLAGVTDPPNLASDRMLRRAGFEVLGECPGPRGPLRTYLYEPPGLASQPREA